MICLSIFSKGINNKGEEDTWIRTGEYIDVLGETKYKFECGVVNPVFDSSKAPSECDFSTDTLGLELNRQTITGEFDLLYKSLIEIFENAHLQEEDYFPKYLKAHLDRGAQMLYTEYRYNKDFLLALLSEKKSI